MQQKEDSKRQTSLVTLTTRAPAQSVQQQASLLAHLEYLQPLLDAVGEFVMILNPQRQIIFANRSFLDFLGLENAAPLYGARPGEALRCVNAYRNEDGCGCSQFCENCGAISAILAAQAGYSDVEECRILQKGDGRALDLRVRTTPFELAGQEFVVCTATDASHENRRRRLERIFFHDVMNIAVSLRMLARMAAKSKPGQAVELAGLIESGLSQLIEEISSQKDLSAAENSELTVRPVRLTSLDLVRELIRLHEESAKQCEIRMDPLSEDVPFHSDRTLVVRVLHNMLKNAVEASSAGEVVTLGCCRESTRVKFWVHNPAFIPLEVQRQMFLRSYSTKGEGRGVGTYSMKLLSERYLNGDVSFTSSPEQGTTYEATYPMG